MKSVLKVVGLGLILFLAWTGHSYYQFAEERIRKHERTSDLLVDRELGSLTLLREKKTNRFSAFELCYSKVSSLDLAEGKEWFGVLSQSAEQSTSDQASWLQSPANPEIAVCFDDADLQQVRDLLMRDGFFYRWADFRVDDELNPSWVWHLIVFDHEQGRLYQQVRGDRPAG